jgi:hypothetical protein
MKGMHFQHAGAVSIFNAHALLGWALATIIVLAAVLGPSLSGRCVPTIIELRHDVLMIDREFERWAVLADPSSPRTRPRAHGGVA